MKKLLLLLCAFLAAAFWFSTFTRAALVDNGGGTHLRCGS